MTMRTTDNRPLAGIASCADLPPMTMPQEEWFDPELPAGAVLDGRFRIAERMARSRRSTLYRAADLARDEAAVAIKIPLLQVESDPAGFAQFRSEENIGLQLRHPGLLRFHATRRGPGRAYLATEFLDGCTLADLRRERGPLPEADALAIAAAVADALQHLHDKGFVHRDLKPANIVLCRDGTLRVIDFGQAGPRQRKAGLLAGLQPVVATPEYMAPEQVVHGPSDERTDVYSLGALLYEMLTGEVPFKSDDAWAAAFRRTTGDPVAPRQLNPAVSPIAEEIVLHALRRDPRERFGSMAEFGAALRSPARVEITGLAGRLRAPRWRLSFHGTPIAAGIVIGLVALAMLVALFLALATLKPGR